MSPEDIEREALKAGREMREALSETSQGLGKLSNNLYSSAEELKKSIKARKRALRIGRAIELGLCLATIGVAGLYVLNIKEDARKRQEELTLNPLLAEIRNYDSNQDGVLQGSELERFVRDYNFEKK